MSEHDLRALSAVRLNFTAAPDDVWDPAPVHVDGFHEKVTNAVLAGLKDARKSSGASPVGVLIQGQRGTGKTHLLGWLREQVQAADGYFFLVELLNPAAFWQSTVLSILDGLTRKVKHRQPQLTTLLARLAARAGLDEAATNAVCGKAPLTKPMLDEFVALFRNVEQQAGLTCKDTLRALALYRSGDLAAQDIAHNYLLSQDEDEEGERALWGMKRASKEPKALVRELSWLLSLTGPSVIAIDQIDALVATATKDTTGKDTGTGQTNGDLVLEQVADGLLSLREVTRRTLTVLSALPGSWTVLQDRAVDTLVDRFRDTGYLRTIPSRELGIALVQKRLAVAFKKEKFTPPYPTWPVLATAFEEAQEFTPRQILRRLDKHIEACVESGVISELERFSDDGTVLPPPPPPEERLAAIDERFTKLKQQADVAAALVAATEDTAMPRLLAAGLEAWILEQGEAAKKYSLDQMPTVKPPLHARLRVTLDEATEDEAHWAFRAISSSSPIAVITRIKTACTMSGVAHGVPNRKLFLLRNTEWAGKNGPKVKAALQAYEAAGGRTLPVAEDDLRVLSALSVLIDENPNQLQAWLVARRPTTQVSFLQDALAELSTSPNVESPAPKEDVVSPDDVVVPEPLPSAPHLVLGRAVENGNPVAVELESLRKHTAIFAGSGSGKTVLIRRLVEECALQGVSAIVLDPNNDIARLGDAWPQAPSAWGAGDAEKSAQYLAETDVVIWTPGWETGRPLSFQPLPDFAAVKENKDEFNAAVDAAVATLAPRALVDGTTAKAQQGKAVLKEVLQYFAKHSGYSTLKEFVLVLSEHAGEISQLANAEKLGPAMAETLLAAMVNDPLFGGAGASADPGMLLTPPPGKRARVSVVSMVGLPSDEQRQSFVNQLQMALFAWVKKHPAGDRPLGGLFVMDEAQTLAPSGAMTACTKSTLALASQARKYGLGLVFATQAPKGLHNQIPGNAATQFFGLLNAPAQIAAAQEMAKAKQGSVPDIGKMGTGQFYVAAEEKSFVKTQTPLCLSYHPKSPLTTEEVVERARA
ncbi:helicase HerA domain-containing protein [Cryptosporangium aurantiacum]|uniref:AAA+ ATPase domain-containing protein n=1 Tax=Cryptosporangium aurantiacum TaxID=134849 RepID=A0A1M7GXC1_9ACTN|nr:DUF87 domain-containing protein [Cryptosporangium aurantiacum]SHM20509.1 protein of unknown function DUF87 [Cryptosporangium aurantiacum]